MLHGIYRLFLATIAYIIAALSASAVIMGGLLRLAPDNMHEDGIDKLIFIWSWLTHGLITAASTFPIMVIAIIWAEIGAIRHWLVWVGVGLATGLLTAWRLDAIERAAQGAPLEIFLAAGILFGLVYWLIAGRSSGLSIRSTANQPENTSSFSSTRNPE